jgi:hypothetical protein
MARTRAAKTAPFIAAFAGSGDVDQKNVDALLDNFFPETGDMQVVIPDTVRRSQKGLMAAWNWATEFEVPVEKLDPADFITYLKAQATESDASVFLVLAWKDGDKIAEQLLDQASKESIPVKDLCKALDDLEFDEEEDDQAVPEQEEEDHPAAAAKTRGKPRGGTAQAKDTEVPAKDGLGVIGGEFFALGASLEAIIRNMIREELNPEKATVAALVNEDGEYKLGGKGRPGKGWTAVKLTPTEAHEAGLDVPEE